MLWSGIRTEDRDGTGVLALRSDETAARTNPGHAAVDAADGRLLKRDGVGVGVVVTGFQIRIHFRQFLTLTQVRNNCVGMIFLGF